MVVAEGHLHWDETAGRFDPDRSDAALPVLTEPGVLPAEPLYVDVSGEPSASPFSTAPRRLSSAPSRAGAPLRRRTRRRGIEPFAGHPPASPRSAHPVGGLSDTALHLSAARAIPRTGDSR
jgi:hypothetical protein